MKSVHKCEKSKTFFFLSRVKLKYNNEIDINYGCLDLFFNSS